MPDVASTPSIFANLESSAHALRECLRAAKNLNRKVRGPIPEESLKDGNMEPTLERVANDIGHLSGDILRELEIHHNSLGTHSEDGSQAKGTGAMPPQQRAYA